MTKPMIKDLKLNEAVDSCFVIKQKQVKKTVKQEDYLILKLADASGEIEARAWSNCNFAEVLPLLKEDSLVRVFADTGEYQGKKQLTIKKMKIAEPAEYDLADFIRQTKKDIPQTLQKVKDILNTIQDKDFKKLTGLFLQDEQLLANFAKAPAAQAMHSACIGGLLEHVAAMLDMAVFLAEQYPLDRELLLLGVFLHDIGKLRELEYSKMTFGYTDEGNMLGHINIGVEMLQEKIRQIPDFPAQKKMLLEHLILSHHGKPEFGSAKMPMTKEAVALHYIDNIDAKLVGFDEFVENNPTDTNWTAKAYMFENNRLYVGDQKATDA